MSDMETAYKIAALAVRQRLAEQHPESLRALDRLRGRDVAVYAGSFDHVEEVLKCLRVPFTLNPKAAGTDARVVFANCSSNYDGALLKAARGLVEDGRWLVSSDWGLGYLVQPTFPNTVRYTSRATADEVVSVEANRESLWADVVVPGADPQWWLEGSSHSIEVLDSERVQIEAASHDLLRKYEAPVVAVRFGWGRGHVFHVISHFWHRRSRTPSERYAGPGAEFLRAGMRLSDDGIDQVLRQAKAQPDTVNFAQLQSAATATELVAQLCVRAVQTVN